MRRRYAFLAAALLIASVPAGLAGHATEEVCGAQDDGGSGADAPGEDENGSVELGEGEVTGCLDGADEVDRYATTLEKGERIRIELTEASCERAGRADLELRISTPRLLELHGCESDGSPGLSFVYQAEETERISVAVRGNLVNRAVNYTLLVDREVLPLPDPAVVAIDDGIGFGVVDTPAGEVPVSNVLFRDTQPLEPRRQRAVSVTVGNLGNGTAVRPVHVTLYAVPENCLLSPRLPVFGGSATLRLVEHARCGPERVLEGTVRDLAVGQNVTFSARWDTTTTVGDQRLVGTLEGVHPFEREDVLARAGERTDAADLDHGNNVLETETPVLVGTERGMN